MTISLKERKSASKVLFFTLIFTMLSYSILFSTLILFMTKSLKLEDTIASNITATFIAFHYVLQLVGGFITGRFFSHRTALIIGMILQTIGCVFLAFYQLYWGLAIFLSGTGFKITCVNCILTQFFEPHDKKREGAFLINYTAMNIGAFIGLSLSGFLEIFQRYSILFIIAAISNILSMFVIIIKWKTLKDRNTYNQYLSLHKRKIFFFLGTLIILAVIVSLRWLIVNSYFANNMIMLIGIITIFTVVYFALTQAKKITQEKIWAYLILMMVSLIFWTLYLLAPIGLTLFIANNVNRHILGITIAPQWALNINAIILIICAPSLAYFYKSLRKKGYNITIPIQFTISLVFIGIGFIILPLGIKLASPTGLVNFSFIAISYVFQSLGEVLISPIGYAMIGQLIPQRLQGIMLGIWMMIVGVSATVANIFSKMAIGKTLSVDPLVTNYYFSKTFLILGIGALIAAIIMLFLIPFLNKLIKEKGNFPRTSSHVT